MRKIILPLMLFASANIYANSINLTGISHNQSVACSNQVYVEAKKGALLKEKPQSWARTVMKLKSNQYLCVVADAPISERWVLVKKVPLISDEAVCNNTNSEKCVPIADFQTKWRVEKPVGAECRLTSTIDKDQIFVVATGVCATGWIKAEAIRFFAD
ncbi:hypothetical protein [Neisseria arctica]|nr:hypothetical protein [Neisseria arctica]UOO85830.1 hypothetical protein LVJ86_06180 [Neisseria arctica]